MDSERYSQRPPRGKRERIEMKKIYRTLRFPAGFPDGIFNLFRTSTFFFKFTLQLQKVLCKGESGMMKNSHSRGPAAARETRDKPFSDNTGGDVCGHVNQDNNLPILWRFSACPTPFFATVGYIFGQ